MTDPELHKRADALIRAYPLAADTIRIVAAFEDPLWRNSCRARLMEELGKVTVGKLRGPALEAPPGLFDDTSEETMKNEYA